MFTYKNKKRYYHPIVKSILPYPELNNVDKLLILKYKGGLSDAVVYTKEFIEYVKDGHPCGYIGEWARTKKKDKIVEESLKTEGLGPSGIADWLSSGNGRHMMDSVERNTKEKDFIKHVKDNITGAFIDVTLWNHPDHRGSLASTIELREKLYKALREERNRANESLRKDRENYEKNNS